jgi:hypothetical protein
MKRKATAHLARLEPTKNWAYSQFSLYAVAGTEMMVTALISVARKLSHTAQAGTRRRARKKSTVSRWRRVNQNPIASRTTREPARTT